MKLKRILLGLLIASACLAKTHLIHAQAADIQQIVDRFYPQTLVDQADNGGTGSVPLHRNSCHAVYDKFPGGSPKTIIAGYTNNVGGAIRVLQATTPGSFQVIFEPTNLNLVGVNCGITLKDIDGDGKKEVIVSFSSFRGNSMDWIFRWDGSKLTNIGPTTTTKRGSTNTKLMNSAFFDIYHDGTLQIVSVGESPSPIDGSQPSAADDVYRIVKGHYVLATPVLFFSTFYRGKAKPVTRSDSFNLLANSKGPYTLRVTNGGKNVTEKEKKNDHDNDEDDRDDVRIINRVDGGDISINGVEVVEDNMFKKNEPIFSVPLNNLKPQGNEIKVTLEGKPGGFITVTVVDASASAPSQPQ